MAKIYWRNGWAWAYARVEGVAKREPLDTKSAREAEERFQQWMRDIGLAKDRWSKDATPFRTAVDTFTDDHLPNLKPASRKRYLVSLLALAPFFETKSLQEISKADLMKFVAARRRGGVADGTIRRDLSCLSSVYTIATDYDLCDHNPVLPFLRQHKRRKSLVEADPRTRYLFHDEEKAILDRAQSEIAAANHGRTGARALSKLMIMAAIILAIDTGLRDEELLRLDWDHVDFERTQVVVSADRAKNSKARVVPLLPRAMDVMQRLRQLRHHRTQRVLWHRGGTEFHDLNHSLQRIAAAAGVTGIRWHDLRKTCGCRLLQDHKMPIEQVSLWLGHSSVKQTQDAYAFLSVEDLHHSIGSYGSELGSQRKDELQRLRLPDVSQVAAANMRNDT